MTKPTDYPDFATDTNFTNGPDVGTATKIEPSAGELAEGHIRETAPSPQKMNWWQGLVGDWVRWLDEFTKRQEVSSLSRFDTLRDYTLSFENVFSSYGNTIGRNPLNGRYYIGQFDTSSDDLILYVLDETSLTDAAAIGVVTSGTHTLGQMIFEPADDVAGVPGLYVVGSVLGDDQDIRVFRSNNGGDPDSFVSVGTHSGAGSGSRSYLAAAHDAVNDALIIAVQVDAGIYCLRVADDASPSLTTPTTEPVYLTPTGTTAPVVAAAGGGAALFCYEGSGVSGFVFYRSTDGGDTWAAATAVSLSGSSNDQLGDLQYYESFLGLGAGFVCVLLQYDGSSVYEYNVFYSDDDGDTWTSIISIPDIPVNTAIPRLVGEWIVANEDSTVGTGAVRICSIKTGEMYVINNGGHGGAEVTRDREMTRFASLTLSGSKFIMSGPVAAPRTLAGGPLL